VPRHALGVSRPTSKPGHPLMLLNSVGPDTRKTSPFVANLRGRTGLLKNLKVRFDPSFYLFLEDSGFLSLPVLIFLVGALVVLFLALGQTDVQLGAALVPMKVERNERIAFALNCASEPIEFPTV